LNENILLITGNDDTYRQPLLEAQGYSVQATRMDQAMTALDAKDFQLVLITTEHGISETLAFCERLKAARPNLRVGILAQRAEYIPVNTCADVVVRAQYSPAKFLAALKRILEAAPSDGRGVLVDDDIGN
jgi:DNA-binding response OmpR family regulator